VRDATPRRLSRFLSLVLCCALFVSAASATASPASISATRKEAAQAQAKIDELATELEMRSEEYLAAREALVETRQRLRATEVELAAAEREVAAAQISLRLRASSIYRDGATGAIALFVGTTDFQDFVTRVDLLQRIGRSDAALVSRVKMGREKVARAQAALETRRAEQAVLVKRADAEKKNVEAALSDQRDYLASVNSRLKRLIAEQRAEEERKARERARAQAAEAAARAAAAAAAAQSASGGAGTGVGGGTAAGPPSAAQGSVTSIARSFIGRVPYVWGGTTPAGFDCSGFTMYCYRQVGVYLPRTSRSQYTAGTSIPRERLDQLRPGDLVFFGYDGDASKIHHVGIYSGNGLYVHAPQTGEMVSESSLLDRIARRGDYVGAVRP
jgi:cell wall-associated NlpC family hydrolase